MDFNTYGAKKKLIEQYFSSFLPNEENNKCIMNIFENFKETFNEYEANTVRLQFGAFENRKSTMNKQAILMLIKALNIDLDSIKSIKVRYKNNKNKMEDIDLKNVHTILSVKVLESSNEKNPAPEYLEIQ